MKIGSQPGVKIYLLDIKTKQLQKWLGKRGMNYSQATISQGGKYIAFTQTMVNSYQSPVILSSPWMKWKKIFHVINHDRSINAIHFTRDDNLYIFAAFQWRGSSLQSRYRGIIFSPLSSYDEGISSFDLSEDQFAFAKTNISSPSELYSGMDLKSQKPWHKTISPGCPSQNQ